MSILSRIRSGFDSRQPRVFELAAISDAELAAFGLSRADLAAVAEMPPEQVSRMEAMAGVFGVDLGQNPQLRADVARHCAGCTAQSDCRHALADPEGPRPQDMGFCPNGDLFTLVASAGPA
jgi:uncharacterized protein YjiS (DUF1127 family)